MAGGLGLALAGPRQYHGTVVTDAWMGDGGRTGATAARTSAGRLEVTKGRGCLILLAVATALIL